MIASRKIRLTVLLFLALIMLNGCQQEAEYFVELRDTERGSQHDGESILKSGDPVFIDEVVAGRIKRIESNSLGQVALIRIKKKYAEQAMRTGIVRDPTAGRIELTTAGITNAAPLLSEGSMIPATNELEFAVLKYSNRQTFLAVGIAMLGILTFAWLFKMFFSAVLIAISLGLSGGVAWLSHPLAVPFVESAYTMLSEQQAQSSPIEPPTAVIDGVAARGVEILSSRPDPKYVAFASIFLLAFVIVSIIMGYALKTVKGQ